jgi:hypothetical protein
VFDRELAGHLDAYKAELPGLTTTTRDYNGATITASVDPSGVVRQQRAQVGDLSIVSNSPRACERVLDALQGKTPRLGDEPDLKYMLARDPGAHPAFAFLSDKFIGAVVGPQQKVLAARRQQALAELLTPGYAALLHGWLFGKAPASTEALKASGLLVADELKHADGAAITFAPGRGASSTWGRPSALTPLIDLAPVVTVTEAEKLAYENFVRGYQQYWKQFIDPVAVRLDVRDEGGGSTAELDVRILPLISATDYSEIEAIVGSTRVAVSALDNGLQAVWAVGKDARLRGQLDGIMRSMTNKSDIGLGWLGDWVLVGLEDRAALVEMLSKFDDRVQLANPKPKGGEFEDLDLWQRVGQVPALRGGGGQEPGDAGGDADGDQAGCSARSRRAGSTGARSSKPPRPADRPRGDQQDGAAAAEPRHRRRGRAALRADRARRSCSRSTSRRSKVVGRSRCWTASCRRAGREGTLAVRDPGPLRQPGAPLWTALLWLIQGQANEAQAGARRSAEIAAARRPGAQGSDPNALFAARGLDYFGFAPVNAQGTFAFTLDATGAGDPLLGSAMVPVYVPLPLANSPVERLMVRLTGLRGEVAFDKEPEPAGPNARSLHTRFSLKLGGVAP